MGNISILLHGRGAADKAAVCAQILVNLFTVSLLINNLGFERGLYPGHFMHVRAGYEHSHWESSAFDYADNLGSIFFPCRWGLVPPLLVPEAP